MRAINAQPSKSERWKRFMETTAACLQVGLTVQVDENEQFSSSAVCPVCRSPYYIMHAANIPGDTSGCVIIELAGGMRATVRGCSCAASLGLPLSERSQRAQELLSYFHTALQEGVEGGQRSIELSALRRMNYTVLSMLSGTHRDDAGLAPLELILSALIILLDAEGSWLKFSDGAEPLIKGDEEAVLMYLRTGSGGSGLTAEIVDRGRHVILGVLSPANIERAKTLLSLMAQECTIVFEITHLFRLLHQHINILLGSISSAVAVLDYNETIIYVNKSAEALFERSYMDMVGGHLTIIPGPWVSFLGPSAKKSIRGNMEWIKMSSRHCWVDWQLAPLKDGKRTAGWILLVDDRSEYHQLQEAMFEAERLTTTAALAGSLAHELRNPLSAARGLLQLISRKKDPGKVRPYTEMVIREVDRMTRFLNEFLLLGKPAVPSDEPVSLALFLRDLEPLLQGELMGLDIELAFDVSAISPVRADTDQLTQVMLNLMRNAAEAIKDDHGQITISLRQHDAWVVLSVRDSGSGFSSLEKDKLFRPFFTTKQGGTGLGLSVIQAIVHNHGGQVDIENVPEGGAQVTIKLPAQWDSKRMLDVLVVLEQDDTHACVQHLRAAQFSVANGLIEFLPHVEDIQPSVLLVDEGMLTSPEVIKTCQTWPNLQKLIVASCVADDTSLKYLPKPLDYGHLVSRIKLLLDDLP